MKNRRKGFSLVEIAIVVSIIGILAALAIPMYNKIVLRSKISSFASDIRVHSESITRYALEEGEYPSDQVIEDIASGIGSQLDSYLSSSWYQPTPIGGVYSLNSSNLSDGNLLNVYIQVSSRGENKLTVGYEDLVKLDEEIDDGNPGSGIVRVSGSRLQYYIVAKN